MSALPLERFLAIEDHHGKNLQPRLRLNLFGFKVFQQKYRVSPLSASPMDFMNWWVTGLLVLEFPVPLQKKEYSSQIVLIFSAKLKQQKQIGTTKQFVWFNPLLGSV
jgi:hypothetical protein